MKILISFFLMISVLFTAGCSKDEGEILTSADQMPQFPGGVQEMYKFLYQHIKYPAEAREAGISGQVNVKFYVDRNGILKDVHAAKGIGYGCDDEAVRVVELMNLDHRWIPGMHEGKTVSVYFTLPIKYVL